MQNPDAGKWDVNPIHKLDSSFATFGKTRPKLDFGVTTVTEELTCICTCAIDARTLIWTGLSTFIIRACQCTCLLPVKATPLVESHGYFPEVSATALATKMFLWLATPPTDLVLIGLFHQTIILDVYFGWESTARIKVQRPEHCTS